MSVEGMSQSELSEVLFSRQYATAIASAVLHTASTNFEGGFKIGLDETGFTYSQTVLAQDMNIIGVSQPRSGMTFPEHPNTVASFHTHPSDSAIHGRDTMSQFISIDDLVHMKRRQESCATFIAGVVSECRSGGNKITLALHRATRPLPEDRSILEGDYWRAFGSDFSTVLHELLGVTVVRVGFDVVPRPLRRLTVRPSDDRGTFDKTIAPLFSV